MKRKYRIIELKNGKFEVQKKKKLFWWKHFIYEKTGSAPSTELYFDTAEEAEKTLYKVLDNESKEFKIIKEIER